MTELATNLIKHARGGRLILTPLGRWTSGSGWRLSRTTRGRASPTSSRPWATVSRRPARRGTGLGAVNRLMDELDITSRPRQGHAHRVSQMAAASTSRASGPARWPLAWRPGHVRVTSNGDAFVVRQWAESALVGVIDGLGHGQFAHRAAETARQYVENHFDLPLDQIFRGVGPRLPRDPRRGDGPGALRLGPADGWPLPRWATSRSGYSLVPSRFTSSFVAASLA